jgi:hypothetical protein
LAAQSLSDSALAEKPLLPAVAALKIRTRFVGGAFTAANCGKPKPGRLPRLSGSGEARQNALALDGRKRRSIRGIAGNLPRVMDVTLPA